MRILCTGGAGFVGSALVRRLVADGHDVGVLDDFSRGRQHRVPEQALVMDADIREYDAVLDAVSAYDVVFHLAYVQGTQTFYEQPHKVIDVALHGIMNVLDACTVCFAERNPKELFLISSSEAYQIPPEGYTPTAENVPLSVPDVTNPRYSYGGGKIASEVAAFAYQDVLKRLVVVRPHNIYGADMGYEHVIPEFALRMQSVEDDVFPIQGTGEESRCFCYIDDAVDGLALLLDRGMTGEVYHLGNPVVTTISDLAYRTAAYYSKQVVLKPGKLPQGSPPRRLPDIGKLIALGFEPKVPLVAGLPVTLDWYTRNPVPA